MRTHTSPSAGGKNDNPSFSGAEAFSANLRYRRECVGLSYEALDDVHIPNSGSTAA